MGQTLSEPVVEKVCLLQKRTPHPASIQTWSCTMADPPFALVEVHVQPLHARC
jgi:hypothetical protein